MPESLVQYQVERTPEGHFVRANPATPPAGYPGCPNHATRIDETLLDGDVAPGRRITTSTKRRDFAADPLQIQRPAIRRPNL